jgi:opacity protein-like surface antigen
MKRFLLIVCAVFFFTVAAHAQTQVNGKVEVYGGYNFQYAREGAVGTFLESFQNESEMHGFHVGTSIWLSGDRKLGINSEYSFSTQGMSAFSRGFGPFPVKGRTQNHSIVTGPIFRFSTNRVRPFVRALVGVNRATTRFDTIFGGDFIQPGLSVGHTAVSFLVGGGVDLNLTKSGRFALRAGAVDYQFKEAGGEDRTNRNGIRVSTGLVVRF